MNCGVSQPEERSCFVVWLYGSSNCIFSSWQQGEQTVAVVSTSGLLLNNRFIYIIRNNQAFGKHAFCFLAKS